MNEKKTISIIVPVYNEQSVISYFFERMTNVLDELEQKYLVKVILIDDGSTDNSWNMIRGKSTVDGCYNGIRLSRNFGHQAALSCGYEFAPGDAVISIDADLQDPPEVIPELLRQL